MLLVVVVEVVDVLVAELEMISCSCQEWISISECYLTCRGGTCNRCCYYIEKILLTLLKFKVYLQVVDVVDVEPGKMNWFYTFCFTIKLTCRGGTCCRRCTYSKTLIITEFKFKEYSLVEVLELVVLVLLIDVLVAELELISYLSYKTYLSQYVYLTACRYRCRRCCCYLK